jgi:hypothetical protein
VAQPPINWPRSGQEPAVHAFKIVIFYVRLVSSKYCHALEFGDPTAKSTTIRIRRYIVRKLTDMVGMRMKLLEDLEVVFRSGGPQGIGSLGLVRPCQKIIHRSASVAMTDVGRDVDATFWGSCRKEILIEAPEVLKLTCELSYELLQIVGYKLSHDDSVNTYYDSALRDSIFESMSEMLDSMLLMISPTQTGIVQNMKACLFSTVGKPSVLIFYRASVNSAARYLMMFLGQMLVAEQPILNLRPSSHRGYQLLTSSVKLFDATVQNPSQVQFVDSLVMLHTRLTVAVITCQSQERSVATPALHMFEEIAHLLPSQQVNSSQYTSFRGQADKARERCRQYLRNL